MNSLFRSVPLALALIVMLFAPASVSAQSSSGQEPTAAQRAHARELYGQGQAAYTAGHYQEALDAYNGAFREVPNPVVLLGVALAQEHLGQLAESRATLERYLALRPDAPDRASVEARIAALPAPAAPTTGTVHVSCTPAGASIELDGHTIGVGTAEATASVGAHELRVSMEGHDPIVRTLDVAAGQRIDLELALAATAQVASSEEGGTSSEDDVFGAQGTEDATEEVAETESPTETPPPADPSAGVWVTTAIAGVALVTGTIFGFLALSKQSDFDAMPSAGAANDGETFALVADLSFAVAAAAGITAIVLYATERPSQPADTTTALRVVPLVSPTGGGVALGASF